MKDLNTEKWIISNNYRAIISLFLIFICIFSFAGNIAFSYGYYLPNMHEANDANFKGIKNSISEQIRMEKINNKFPLLNWLDNKNHNTIILDINSNSHNFRSKFFYYNEETVKNLIKINGSKTHKKEYISKLFDKTKYETFGYGFQREYEENDPYIQEIACNITNNLENPTRKTIAEAVYKWVDNNVDYEYPVYYESKHYASQTAKLKKGNCCDQARLVIALCRAAGIPTYATEYYHSDTVVLMDGKIVGHVWPVITDENGEKIVCDTSCYGCSFGSPSWKNLGCVKQSCILSF